jgi:hypothetical protein
MKFLLCLSLLLPLGLAAQITVSGQTLDQKTGEPVPYVNIGVVGKGIGTVSDLNGRFSIPLHDSINGQTLRFSCIGYKNRDFTVSAFKVSEQKKVTLEEQVINLPSVAVKPRVMKTKTLGNKNSSRAVTAGFTSDDLGSELGTIMKIPKAPAMVQSASFSLAYNNMDSVKFRVNIYSMKNGQPDSNLLAKPIYLTTKLKSGVLFVDLRPYNIWVDSDFLVSLEWIQDYGRRQFSFSAAILQNNSMYRKTSQDKWHKTVGIGFNAEVTYEK